MSSIPVIISLTFQKTLFQIYYLIYHFHNFFIIILVSALYKIPDIPNCAFFSHLAFIKCERIFIGKILISLDIISANTDIPVTIISLASKVQPF